MDNNLYATETMILSAPEYAMLTLLDKSNNEILRFENNGDIFVHGVLIENNKQVVDGFREFLNAYGMSKDVIEMNSDTHVYCTDCKHFRLDDEEIPHCVRPNNKRCNGFDIEDSMPFSERPQYEEKENNLKWLVDEKGENNV